MTPSGCEHPRCAECVEIGCECPMGYWNGEVLCQTCGARYVLTYAECLELPPCAKCGAVSSTDGEAETDVDLGEDEDEV